MTSSDLFISQIFHKNTLFILNNNKNTFLFVNSIEYYYLCKKIAMRIICDAPGQTCNRLWTYVASVAQCIVEKKKMIIIFFDWTIEDFPNLLHAKFIYFPLWWPWFLKLPKGWGWYKHLTWKITHNKTWDKIFQWFGCTKGWYTMDDTRYLIKSKKGLVHIFRPKEEITSKAHILIDKIRNDNDIIIGVHIRHGDYKTWRGGRHYYTFEEFHSFMLQIKELYLDCRVAFFISSNAQVDTDIFQDCNCFKFDKEPSGDILDLYTLSLCDRIIGPWSTYSRWASFIGDVPLCFIKNKEQKLKEEDFSIVTDFYHFANGESTEEFWTKDISK